MGSYVNFIKINQSIDTVYNWATIPSYWPKYHPLSKAVAPIIDYSPNTNERFKETISILSVQQEIEWVVTKIDPPTYFEIDGYVSGFMGGNTKIKYTLRSFKNSTIFRREIIVNRNNKIMDMVDKLAIDYYVKNDANVALDKMKDFLELMPKGRDK